MSCMNFTVHNKEGERPLNLEFERVFAIGYAGRNMEKTMEHIRELERELGVPGAEENSHHFPVRKLCADPGAGSGVCG